MPTLTPSKLYSYLKCPHRVWRDEYGPQEEKDTQENAFVKMLWERGVNHEKEVVEKIGVYVDMSEGSLEERFQKTLEALRKNTPLLYQGVLRFENDLGIPDLLMRMPDGKYIPIDIKSGSGVEGVGDDEGEQKPKKYYAVQLCFYIELLQKLSIPHTGTGRIIDIHHNVFEYELSKPLGKRDTRTFWEFYEQTKKDVSLLIHNQYKNTPAMSGVCKLCPWYRSCKKWCEDKKDITTLYYVGRKQRDVLEEDLGIKNVFDVSQLDAQDLIEQKKKDKHFLGGIGKSSLEKMITRAHIVTEVKKPVVYEKIIFPRVSYELFFDIEDDPTQEFVYMHGVYERSPSGERFIHFTAKEKTSEAQKDAWMRFWKYIETLPKGDFSVYYYSHHEKTTYRKMQKLYPDSISSEYVEAFFANPYVIDLYAIISSKTDWPLGSYSLKAIAQYLGFSWRDETPSGALSIEWFNAYLETKDESFLQRILLYNEDDCKATMIIKDALEKME